jgi:glutamate 5-kinase
MVMMNKQMRRMTMGTTRLDKAQRVVIKVGSALVANGTTGEVNHDWLCSMAEDIALLRAQGKEVILVTSGAVSLGRSALNLSYKKLKIEEKQAAAACGQIRLMEAWASVLNEHKVNIAQLLLTLEVSEERRRYLNARATIQTLLAAGVVPVVNENDTVATEELRVGDNDRLAARVAQMAGADVLVLLSDVDGMYTADPTKDVSALHLPEITGITDEIRAMAGGAASMVGTGGMRTKVDAAEIALSGGCHMVITRGSTLRPLSALQGGAKATWFVSNQTAQHARKDWIAGSLSSAGNVVVDDGAAKALRAGKSLLPAGVTLVEGDFERGDAVLVKDKDGRILAKGLVAYDIADATRIIGRKSEEIEAILGFKGRDALIHRDDLVMV